MQTMPVTNYRVVFLQCFSVTLFRKIIGPKKNNYFNTNGVKYQCGCFIPHSQNISKIGFNNSTDAEYVAYLVNVNMWLQTCSLLRAHPISLTCITARRYASAVLGIVILTVRLSVCPSHACFVTNPKNLPAIFL